MDQENQTLTQHSQRELSTLRSSTTAVTRTEISFILARLALHYPKRDFTKAQASLLIDDFLEAIGHYSSADIQAACKAYLENGENHWFPTPGQLLAILRPQREPEERHAKDPFRSSRPAIEMKRATKSVAQVLEEHGFSADKWRK